MNQVVTKIEEPMFITRRGLASRWSVSTESLKRYEQRGLLKGTRFGARCVRYRFAHVLEIERKAESK